MKTPNQIINRITEINKEVGKLIKEKATLEWVLKGEKTKPKKKKPKIFAEKYLKGIGKNAISKKKRGRPRKEDMEESIEKLSRIKISDGNLE